MRLEEWRKQRMDFPGTLLVIRAIYLAYGRSELTVCALPTEKIRLQPHTATTDSHDPCRLCVRCRYGL